MLMRRGERGGREERERGERERGEMRGHQEKAVGVRFTAS